MHVGIFSESYPPLVNGVSTSVLTLIAQLEQAGHRVSVFTSRSRHYKDERPGVYRFPSVNSLMEPDYVLPVPLSPKIMAAIPHLGLDLIHSQSPFLLGLIAQRMARELHLPHIATNHTLYTQYAHYFPFLPPPLTRLALVRWMRGYYNDCDHVLAPSELTRRWLIEVYGVQSPVSIIPTGIPLPPALRVTPAETRRELGLPPEARLLLYVGRLAPEKNLEMLLRSFVQIKAQTTDTYLVIAGSGKSQGVIRRLARSLGLNDRAVFTGSLGRARLDPLYQAADVFLFPSTSETQGVAVGEALAAGTPCVVVNGGGAPESVHDGEDGFLVDDDPGQMTARALKLLRDPDLHRHMSEAACRNAVQRTPEKVASRIMAIYEDLVAARRKEPNPGSFLADPSLLGKG